MNDVANSTLESVHSESSGSHVRMNDNFPTSSEAIVASSKIFFFGLSVKSSQDTRYRCNLNKRHVVSRTWITFTRIWLHLTFQLVRKTHEIVPCFCVCLSVTRAKRIGERLVAQSQMSPVHLYTTSVFVLTDQFGLTECATRDCDTTHYTD